MARKSKAKRKLTYDSSGKPSKKARRMSRNKQKKSGITFQRKNFANIAMQDNTTLPVDLATGFAFKLVDMPGVGDITSLYDQYCIKGIGYRFRLVWQELSPNLNRPFNNIIIIHRVDLDDAAHPTSSNIMECENTVVDYINAQNPVTKWYNFTPRVAQALYQQGGLFTGYGLGKKHQWIDNASTAVEHYGVKFFMPGGVTGTKVQLQMEYRLTVGARNVI